MSLSSKIKQKQEEALNITPMTRRKSISMLNQLKDEITDEIERKKVELSPSIKVRRITTRQPMDEVVIHPVEEQNEYDDEENNTLESTTSSEENFEFIAFVADFKLTDKVLKKLRKFTNVTEFNQKTFVNRDFHYLKANDIKYVWFNITNKDTRQWLQKNLHGHDGYKCVAIHSKSNQKWIADIRKYVDIIVSKRNIGDLSYLTLGELLDELENNIQKIHAPAASCFKQLLYANRTVSKHLN